MAGILKQFPFRPAVLDPEEISIERLHSYLCLYWDELQGMITKQSMAESDVATQACLTILEEDLSDLLAECEEYMIIGRDYDDDPDESISFESRSATILEEIAQILNRR